MKKTFLSNVLGFCVLASLGGLGCSGSDPAVGPGASSGSGSGPVNKPAPAFAPNEGQPENVALAYPAAPYGVQVGSVIEDYHFIGFGNAQAVSTALQEVVLAHFYNPHAEDATYHPASAEEDDRLFPPGSPYGAGTPKPRALVIDVASVWCGPCNQEAATVLPPRYKKYKPCGGEFLLQLADGPTPGTPATVRDLSAWTTKYKVSYASSIDPANKLAPLWAADAYPENMLIDTRTMKIVDLVAGEPDDTFWATFEHTLNNASCLAGH